MASRVYATASDLANYLGESAPANAEQLLTRASMVIDGLLIGAVYATDEQQMPTDGEVADALLDATVAQAAYWHHNGTPAEGATQWGSVSIGSVSLSRGNAATAGEVDGNTLAPGVFTRLRVAGLLPVRPYVYG